MKPLVRWSALAVLLLFANSSCATSDPFLPNSVANEMRENLDGFLVSVPKNNGQRKHIARVLDYSEHNKLMLFVDNDFSEQSIAKIAKLKQPFLLLETLDIVSVNLGKERVFSNYFIDEVVEHSRQESLAYMVSFLRICKKSDGYYSEYLYTKLLNILEKNPKIFLSALSESMAMYEICALFKLGDRVRAISILESVDSASVYSKTASKLVTCLRNR